MNKWHKLGIAGILLGIGGYLLYPSLFPIGMPALEKHERLAPRQVEPPVDDPQYIAQFHPQSVDIHAVDQANLEATVRQFMDVSRLDSEDAAKLLEAIHHGAPEGIHPKTWHFAANEVLNLLRRRPDSVPSVTEALSSLAENAQEDVVRDYALQHLGMWLSQAPSESESVAAEAAMRSAIQNAPDSSRSGTALLALYRNLPEQETKDALRAREEVAALAGKLAENPGAHEATRITAVQVCAGLGYPDVLKTIQELALNASSIPLKLAATAALGDAGMASDENEDVLIRSLSTTDQRLRMAAKGALQKIHDRKTKLASDPDAKPIAPQASVN